jgi:electron transfer flavoprotein beta subunit
VTLVKQSPDVEAITINDDGTPDLSEAEMQVSQYDKNAVEAAVQIQEERGEDEVEVLAVSLADEALEETIKEVLAMGADEARLIQDDAFADVDTAGKARLLAAAVEEIGDVDLVLAADESEDSHSAQTAPRVARHLDVPLLSYVTGLEVEDGSVRVERESDQGIEELQADTPAVISTQEAINEPRLPALTDILSAKDKPMETWDADDLDVDVPEPVTRTVENVAPSTERRREIIEADSPEEAAQELARKLVDEGIVG